MSKKHKHKTDHAHHDKHDDADRHHDQDADGAAGADHMAQAGAAREGGSRKLRIVDKWEEGGKTFIMLETTGVEITDGMTGTVTGSTAGHFKVTKVSERRVAIAETDLELDEVGGHVLLDGKPARAAEHDGGPFAGVVNIATSGGGTVLTLNKGSKAGVVDGMQGTVMKDGEAIGEVVVYSVSSKEAKAKSDVSVEDASGAKVQLGTAPAKKANEVTGNVVNREYPEHGPGVSLTINKGSEKGVRLGMLGTLMTRSGTYLETVSVAEVRKRECVVEAMIDNEDVPLHSQVVFKLDQDQ